MFLQAPAYPATANEAYVYLPLAFGFLQWEILVTKATAVFAPAHGAAPNAGSLFELFGYCLTCLLCWCCRCADVIRATQREAEGLCWLQQEDQGPVPAEGPG